MTAVAPRLLQSVAVLLAGLVLPVAGTAPAAAHAVLTGSTPARGRRSPKPPPGWC